MKKNTGKVIIHKIDGTKDVKDVDYYVKRARKTLLNDHRETAKNIKEFLREKEELKKAKEKVA